jgi:hypothetical protein
MRTMLRREPRASQRDLNESRESGAADRVPNRARQQNRAYR